MSIQNRGSECQMENEQWPWMPNETMALNAKWKQWLWTLKWKSDRNGRRNENAALNAKRKWTTQNAKLKRQMEDRSRCQTKNEQWLWTPHWKYGSERQTKLNTHERQVEKDDSECQNREWHGGSKRRTAREWWGEICLSVACHHSSQSIESVWKRLHESHKML